MNKILFITLLLSMEVFTGCSSDGSRNNNENKSDAKEIAAIPTVKVSFENDSVNAVYDHYIHLKNSLVKSDAKESKIAAESLKSALLNIGSSKGAELAGKIAVETKLSAQRAQFNALTTEVERKIREAKISQGKIYKQYCPMANDGNGGYWLSGESEIKNPYYGNDMLECGDVKDEIK